MISGNNGKEEETVLGVVIETIYKIVIETIYKIVIEKIYKIVMEMIYKVVIERIYKIGIETIHNAESCWTEIVSGWYEVRESRRLCHKSGWLFQTMSTNNLAIATEFIQKVCDSKVFTHLWGSDLLPILLKLTLTEQTFPQRNEPQWNNKKADWSRFQNLTWHAVHRTWYWQH